MRVSFFVAGMQKGGTTALDRHLRTHPGIEMASKKEVHFFDNEALDWLNPDYDLLHAHYQKADAAVLKGEATPIYTYWPNSLERLKQYNPAAKLIVCLRHPAYRAWSHWKMETTRGAETLSFEDAISEAGRDRVRHAPGGVHRVFSYVERGFYGKQVTRMLALFPRSQLHFVKTDDLWCDAGTTLNGLCTFLGLAGMEQPDQAYVVPVDSSALGDIPAGAREALDGLYRHDVRATAAMTGLNLDDWLDADYMEMPSKG
ncbi:MAG: sulfotransferase [Notoacmeibacter sp.]|nr:sulfotransferase [Notoacmeibacter sp.]